MSRLRVAVLSMGLLALAAVALTEWAVPGTERFLRHAPGAFLLMMALAVLVDAPLFGIGFRNELRARSTLSVCLAVVVLLRWGPGPAVVFQAFGATTSVILQRYNPYAALAFVSRHILTLGVVALAVDLLGFAPAVWPEAIRPADLPGFALLAALWAAADGLLYVVAARLLTGWPLRAGWAQVDENIYVVAMSIVLIAPLLLAANSRWSPVLLLPLLARNLLTCIQVRRNRQAVRDSSRLLTRVGLASAVQELSVYHYVRDRNPPPFAVVLCAADRVTRIGRDLGRQFFEGIAVVAAERLKRAYGSNRVGQVRDEGLVVLLAGVGEQDAVARAERVVAILNAPMEINGIPFIPGSAAGVAVSPAHGRDLDALLHKAGLAATEARRLGVTVRLYDPREASRVGEKVALLSEISAVLADPARASELTVLYQPQVDLATRHIVGVEALLRWTHPRWGPVPTGTLVDAIEASEIINELTRWLVQTVLAQISQWNRSGLRVRVAINASARDLRLPSFPDEIAGALDAHGVSPGQLTVEITERLATGADPAIVQAAERVTALGVGLSVDDFGTGQASMQQLRTLPVTEVKVDRSYVSRMLTDSADRAIVVSVHELARALRLDVVAEGVEDEPTAQALSGLAGIVGQGWHLGRPMPADELPAWVDGQRPP